MIKTKENKGITLVSLVITIALMIIISSTTIYTAKERFDLNKFKKLTNDLELLSDKVSNYYLKYNGLPIVRDEENEKVKYTYTSLEFEKSENDNENYYILDLAALEGITLNYGKEGFENINASDDVYIINEKSMIIYYVRGIKFDGVYYYTILKNSNTINDNVPPSKPEIKIISGTTNDNGTYITEVQLEIIPGNDSWSGIEKTTYSINDGIETDIETLTNNIYMITSDGNYEMKARSYDKRGNVSADSTKTIVVNMASIVLDKTELLLEVGNEQTITATLENVSKDLTWTVSEDSGLIISGEGNTKNIIATKVVENAMITVSYGTLNTVCNVTVTEKQVLQNQITE